MHRHSSGLCRKHLAATLRQWANRRADLLAPIARVVKNVFTLVIDICSTVAPHDYAANNSTTHWDDLGKFTFAFLLPLCAANDLKLLIQSGDVRQRLEALYWENGLKEHVLPSGFASVARSFTVSIVVPSIGQEAVQLAVLAADHPASWWTYSDTVALLRLEVCTPRPRRLTTRPSSCSGPRRAQARVFV